MRSRPVILFFGVFALALGVVLGCSSVDQLMDPDPRFEPLVVAYGDPGPSPSPCDRMLVTCTWCTTIIVITVSIIITGVTGVK